MSFSDAASGTTAALQGGQATGIGDVLVAMGKDSDRNASGMAKAPNMLTGMPQVAPISAAPEPMTPFRQRYRGYGV